MLSLHGIVHQVHFNAYEDVNISVFIHSTMIVKTNAAKNAMESYTSYDRITHH